MSNEQAEIISPPKTVQKWAQGGAIIIRFTWDVVGEGKQLCSLDFAYDISLWDQADYQQRLHHFLTDAKSRCTQNSERIPDHLKMQILEDLKQFAASYDWDTDRKIIPSHIQK